jgi:hypothetical protein
MHMKSLVALIFAMTLTVIAPSLAVEAPFNQAQFDSMIAAGKPVAVFKDGKENARSTGDTEQASLAALLRRAIS